MTTNAGYRVARAADGPHSPWTIYAPDGRNLGAASTMHWFATKKEALAYLEGHDIAAEVAERERKERARQEAMDRSARIAGHPLHGEYWALRCAFAGIVREAERIEKDAARPDLELVAGSLQAIAADLRAVAERARAQGQQRYREIAAEVDAEIARETAGVP